MEALTKAAGIVAALPADQAGTAVLASTGELARLDSTAIRDAIDRGVLRFHPGHIGGAWPTMK